MTHVIEKTDQIESTTSADDAIAAAIAATAEGESHPDAVKTTTVDFSRVYSSMGGTDSRIYRGGLPIGNVQAVGYTMTPRGNLVELLCFILGSHSETPEEAFSNKGGPNEWMSEGPATYEIRMVNEYGMSHGIDLGELQVAQVSGGLAVDDMVIEYRVILETPGMHKEGMLMATSTLRH